MNPTQTELIGAHPVSPHFFSDWFICHDELPNIEKCHRSLSSKLLSDDDSLTDWLAQKIIIHHISIAKLNRLKSKYESIGFPEYAAQQRQIPINDNTRKGNATEIILTEYIESCQADRTLIKVFRFHFNPNVDQSMKGDDALIIDLIKNEGRRDDIKVFLGEAKFRKRPDNAVLTELSLSLDSDKIPISFSFLIDRLFDDPTMKDIAEKLEDFAMDEVKAKGNLKYVGLLLSNANASRFVNTNFTSKNPACVLISAGMVDPEKLIHEAFRKAEILALSPHLL